MYGFRFYFIGLTGLLFTFPSRYWFTIDRKAYLALGDSTPGFIRSFPSSNYLRTKIKEFIDFYLRGYHSLWRCFPAVSTSQQIYNSSLKFQALKLKNNFHLTTLRCNIGVWALPVSLAATQGIKSFFIFLRLLRCFTSAGLLPRHL